MAQSICTVSKTLAGATGVLAGMLFEKGHVYGGIGTVAVSLGLFLFGTWLQDLFNHILAADAYREGYFMGQYDTSVRIKATKDLFDTDEHEEAAADEAVKAKGPANE